MPQGSVSQKTCRHVKKNPVFDENNIQTHYVCNKCGKKIPLEAPDPCPICGSEAKTVRSRDRNNGMVWMVHIECSCCGLQTKKYSIKDRKALVGYWNFRVGQKELQSMVRLYQDYSRMYFDRCKRMETEIKELRNAKGLTDNGECY